MVTAYRDLGMFLSKNNLNKISHYVDVKSSKIKSGHYARIFGTIAVIDVSCSRLRDMTLLVALKDVDLKDVHWFAESK